MVYFSCSKYEKALMHYKKALDFLKLSISANPYYKRAKQLFYNLETIIEREKNND